MNDINNINITGRLTKDCEVYKTQSEYAIITLSIASNYSEKNNGQWDEKTNFFTVKSFAKGKQLDYYSSNLKKGLQVNIAGMMKQETWEKGGVKNSKYVIQSDKIIFQGTQSNNQYQTNNSIPDPWGVPESNTTNDEKIPF